MKRNRLTNNRLRRIVSESVRRILNEGDYTSRLSPEEILKDIIGNESKYFDWDDIEVFGNSGKRYRFVISRDSINVAWSPTEEPEWEEGGEFTIRNDERGFETLRTYLHELSE